MATAATIRNVAFCGHGNSGKTTLIDKLLFKTGAVSRAGSVDEKNSHCDFDDEERHHKYTIETKLLHLEHGGLWFNILDTPGYPDYIGQTIGALRGVDNACIVINAHSGIEVNTRRVFEEAGKAGVGRILVINKLDTDNIKYPELIANIQSVFGKECLPYQIPRGLGHDFKGPVNVMKPGDASGALSDVKAAGVAILESVIELDEEVTAKYFEGELPSPETLDRLLVEAVATGHLVPILCVAGKPELGLLELLEALDHCAIPADKLIRKAKNAQGETVDVAVKADGPLVAQSFKTRIDPFVQKLSFVRVYSGTLVKDSTLELQGARRPVKISQLLRMQGNEHQNVTQAVAGDIVAIAKCEDLHTGTNLGALHLPPIQFPTPMVGLAAMPKTRGDEAKLSTSLHKITEEDSTFRLDRDPQTKELVMTGMSELHLQILQERLKRRDKVELETKEPKIPYRETIQSVAEGSYRHKKQSGGRGQFGEVHIRMYPFPPGTKPEDFCTKERFPQMREFRHEPSCNFLWVDCIVGGSIPNNFLPAVEKGFKERLARGVIAGYQIQNVAVEVFFGKYHDVDSSEAAFKTAGSMAFRNVFQQAKPGLLEPIVILKVTVPGEKVGDVNSDMSGRRGRVSGMDAAGGGFQTVTVEVPLAEVTTYARSLSSMTGGQGSYTMEFSRYDVVPGNVQKEIVDKAQLKEEEEE